MIERYVKGLLEGKELEAFEAQLKEDSALAEEVELERGIAEALSEPDVTAFRQTLEEVRLEYHRKGNGRRGLTYIWRTLSIAASIVLMVAAGYWLFQQKAGPPPTADALFDTYFAVPNELVSGSIERDVSKSGKKSNPAMEAWETVNAQFKSGDYESALARLKSFPNTLVNHNPSRYHYQCGLLELALGRPAESLSHFEKIENGYSESRYWFTGLALLKLEGKVPRAKEAFEEVANKQNPWQEDAKKILKKWD